MNLIHSIWEKTIQSGNAHLPKTLGAGHDHGRTKHGSGVDNAFSYDLKQGFPNSILLYF